MSDTLVVNEIYLSLQGESTFAGLPCVFVRLTACNLRCLLCDPGYAFAQGGKVPRAQIRAEVPRLGKPFDKRKTTVPAPEPVRAPHKLPLVGLPGGEPLLQKNALPLMKELCDDGFTVLLE